MCICILWVIIGPGLIQARLSRLHGGDDIWRWHGGMRGWKEGGKGRESLGVRERESIHERRRESVRGKWKEREREREGEGEREELI